VNRTVFKGLRSRLAARLNQCFDSPALSQSSNGFADPLEDETAYVLLPEGESIIAQDKRSAVLG
jgi:hypothetical protein